MIKRENYHPSPLNIKLNFKQNKEKVKEFFSMNHILPFDT